MFECMVGHSLDPDPGSAVNDIFSQFKHEELESSNLAILYISSSLDIASIHSEVRSRIPDIPLIGCTSDGEVSSHKGHYENSAVLVLLRSDEVFFYTGVYRNMSDNISNGIFDTLQKIPDKDKISLIITFPDSLTVGGDAVLNVFYKHIDSEIPVIGALAADQWQFSNTHQFYDSEVLTDAAPFVMITGNIAYSVALESGWLPLGVSGQITKSTGNIVYEIDGKPALCFYDKYLKGRKQSYGEHPLLITKENNGSCLRAPLKWDDVNQSITFAGDVEPGSLVQVTSARRDKIIEASATATNKCISKFRGDLKILLFFSCTARSYILGTSTREECNMAREIINDLPLVGMYGYGEIAPSEGNRSILHNETFVSLCLGLKNNE